MNFSNKIIVYLLGLATGLLVGAGFFIFKIDEYISKIELFKGNSDTVYSVSETKPTEIIKYINSGSKSNSNMSDTAAKPDSIELGTYKQNIDSIFSDTNRSDNVTLSDDIVVMKDELLSVKTINISNSIADTKSNKDSLLEKVSDVRDDAQKQNLVYKVEFWQSPVNYKGYKLINNKIVLFGIAKDENPAIYKFEETLYLKIKQVVYKIDKTSDFKQFESVKDQTLLAKIK